MPQLSLGQIHAALSYLFDHRDDVLREIREDETYVEQLKAASGPSLLQRHRPRATGS